MSADGKVTIQVDLDTSDVGKRLSELSSIINLNKNNIKNSNAEIKRLNQEMADATPSAARKMQASIEQNKASIETSKQAIATLVDEYKTLISVFIESGAASKESLGKTFFANLSNARMSVPQLSELVASGKVDPGVSTMVAEYYNRLTQQAQEAEQAVSAANAGMAASSVATTSEQLAEMNRLREAIAREKEDQDELAQAILRVQLAYQSGKLAPDDMQRAEQDVAQLAKNFNDCSLNINKYSEALTSLGSSESDVDKLAENFDAQSAATSILSNKVKDLTGAMLNNSSLQDRLAANSVKVTAQMRAEEAQVRRNAQAERDMARESALAERDAKGRLTGTLGLLGMINPAFTRLSYAVRQFSKIGGVSFSDLESKVIGFGKSIKALPPKAKVAMAAVAASVGTVVVSLTAMVKTLKTVFRLTKAMMGVVAKAGKAFAKFYDFDDYFGDVDKMVKAYNDLQANELALTALMKSRMGASNEVVDSIKDLIVAEEAEGVVSKQNQTAALKHLAAYTTQSESLKTLLPVLNDFTVQMYGVNATEQQAISAAKLFGKAMKGQTETLRRSGYVTEAQAQAIKDAANETERAALLAKYMGERCGNMNEILAQTDAGQQQKLANSMAEVQREFGQAASVLKTAFIPIATQVLAILARMASYAAALAQSISKLFGGFGKQAAFATTQIEDVADAASGAGKAAKEVSNTLGIDELNILNDNEDSGGAGGGGIDPALMEESTSLVDNLSSAMDDLLAKMKDAYTAGLTMGTALRDALASIPWDDVKQKAYEAGKAVADFANGIVDSGLIEQVGITLAESLNTVTEALLGFVDNFDWSSFGTSLANGLENFITTVDWGRLGKLLGDSLIGVLSTINNFLESFDWRSIGYAIADFLCGINWLELLGQVLEFGLNVLAALFIDLPLTIIALLDGVIDNIAEGITGYINKNMKESGNNVVQAFLSGIVDVIRTVRLWVWDHVVSPIIMAFAKYFGVDADEFHEFGENIINGFFDGIKAIIHDPLGWLKANVVDPFINAFKNLFGIHSPSTVMHELGVFLMQGLFNGIQSLVSTVLSVWNNLKLRTIEIVTLIINSVRDKFNSMRNVVVSIFSGMRDTVMSIFNALSNGIRSIINRIIGFVEGMANGIVSGVNKIIGVLNGFKVDVPKWVADKTGVTSFGFNIPYASGVSIPRLATGAVLPANNPFLAVVGDQKQGTNVEAPLETIQDAVALVLQPYLERLIDITESIDSKDFSVNIGDREIAQANVRGQRQLGATLRTS